MYQTAINPKILDSCEILTNVDALILLRSLSDGLWATPNELAEATPVACERVKAVLSCLVEAAIVDTQGGRFQLNPCQLAAHCQRIRSLVAA